MGRNICRKLLKATEQALARKGARGWGSKGSELSSYNLRGSKEVLKQQTWGTTKVWWAPILSRGKLHVVTFEDDFPGEEPAGAKELVQKLLVAGFSSSPSKPSWVFVDRGRATPAMARSPQLSRQLSQNVTSRLSGVTMRVSNRGTCRKSCSTRPLFHGCGTVSPRQYRPKLGKKPLWRSLLG